MGAPKTLSSKAEDGSTLAEGSPTKKRRIQPPRGKASGKGIPVVVDLTEDEPTLAIPPKLKSKKEEALFEAPASPQKKAKPSKKPVSKKGEEKRLRPWRKKAPQSYLQKLDRARTQRMFILSRNRPTQHTEEVELAGSTGNIYTVTITRQPSCTCPDNRKGNQCKHIVYVLHNVLKVHGELEYQLAYLSSELQEIFEGAPLPAIELAQAKGGSGAGAGDGEGENGHGEDENGHGEEVDATTGTKRRGLDGGDCPICFMPFEPAELKNGDVVWCRAACGNNVHRMCFEQWAEAKRGGEVKCVYCRSKWIGDDDSLAKIKAVKARGKVNSEGYVNVGAALGMGNVRDYSTYHSFWVRRQMNNGETFETY